VLVFKEGASWDSRPISQVVNVDAMDVLPYNEEDDQGGNGPTWAGVGLRRRFRLGLQGPVGPL
jgi:hypothetical protein